MSRSVKFENPHMLMSLYSDSILMAPEFCLIWISGIFNGSHGGINSSGMPSVKFTRIDSMALRRHSFRFGSFRWQTFKIWAKNYKRFYICVNQLDVPTNGTKWTQPMEKINRIEKTALTNFSWFNHRLVRWRRRRWRNSNHCGD